VLKVSEDEDDDDGVDNEYESLHPDRSNDTPEMIKRFITSTSKGLIEIRKGDTETEFIHESINDFLLRNKRLQTIDPGLEPHAIGSSHNRLASTCVLHAK
jgi:hypothetical protein